MQAAEQSHFNTLYAQHVAALKRHGKADKSIDSYARAVRRVARVFDRCPDDLTVEELEAYFTDYIDSHSWSAVTIDRNGLRFFHEQVLGCELPWLTAGRAVTMRHNMTEIRDPADRGCARRQKIMGSKHC
jgi:hypothetical protein